MYGKIIALAAALALSTRSNQVFPAPDWVETADPVASPYAVKGGTLRFSAAQAPKSLNYYIDNNSYTAMIFGLMYSSLLGSDPLSADFTPALAQRWSISDDKLRYTFEIDPSARWSDGVPITASDIKWTFDTIMAPENPTGPNKVIYGKFESPDILDERTIRFTAKSAHWVNLVSLSGFQVLPRHAFAKREFAKLDFQNAVVSGPYAVDRIKESIETRMKRRRDWWAAGKISNRNLYNFDYLVFKYYVDQENAVEALKKGYIDVHPVYTARLWMTETTGEKFTRNWIIKQQVRNYSPIGFQGFVLNMRKFPFDDLRVRKALAHLLDRETMNRTMMYNEYFLHRSYYEDLYDSDHPCENTFYDFNVDKARQLLSEAGFELNPQSGILERNGRELTFTFLTRSSATDKFLVLFNNALQSVGIRMSIERKDLAAWVRDMDAHNFQMSWAAWGASLFRNPEFSWLSSEADTPGSNNYSGFKNQSVDALIAEQRTNFNLNERNAICRRIDKILTDQVPYILLWNTNRTRIFYWNKFGTPSTVLDKYGNERALVAYWWHDPESVNELNEAMRRDQPLPTKPETIDFDDFFNNKSLN